MPNGCMSTGGSSLNWFVRQFASGEALAAKSAGVSTHQWLDRLAEARPAGSDGLVITPYFLGEKTPIHDPSARATFDGLTRSAISSMVRARLERVRSISPTSVSGGSLLVSISGSAMCVTLFRRFAAFSRCPVTVTGRRAVIR